MDHLSPDQIVRYLDDRIPEEEEVAVERHVEACASCRSRLSAGKRTTDRLEEAVKRRDPPAPEERSGETSSRTGTALRMAAVLALLLVGGGVAADLALPGTPVRDWLRSVVGRAPTPRAPSDQGGVGVPLERGAISIRIADAPSGVPVRIRFVEQREALVSAQGGFFETGEGEITVASPGRDTVEVLIPRSADSVDLRSNGQRLLEKIGGEVHVKGTASDTFQTSLVIAIPGTGGS